MDHKKSNVLEAYDKRSKKTAALVPQSSIASPTKRTQRSVPFSEQDIFLKTIRTCRFLMYSNILPVGGRVLDLCCGQGASLPSLIRLGMHCYTGIDGSLEALKEAIHRTPNLTQSNSPILPSWIDPSLIKHPQIQFSWKQMDLNQPAIATPSSTSSSAPTAWSNALPAMCQQNPSLRPDIVLCENALHYLNIPQILNHIRQNWIRPDGYLLLLCVDANQLPQIVKMNPPHPFFHIHQETATDYQFSFTGLVDHVRESKIFPKDLIQFAHQAGFKLVQSRSTWEVRQLYRGLVEPRIVNWIPDHQISEANRLLLQTYRFYLFQASSSSLAHSDSGSASSVVASTASTASTV